MFKIIQATHVTATEKKIIAWMLQNNATTAATKKIRAVMSDLEGNMKKVVFDGRWIVTIEVKA